MEIERTEANLVDDISRSDTCKNPRTHVFANQPSSRYKSSLRRITESHPINIKRVFQLESFEPSYSADVNLLVVPQAKSSYSRKMIRKASHKTHLG